VAAVERLVIRRSWSGIRALTSTHRRCHPSGGFAHGDYLRPGALARFSPVMGAVERFAVGGDPCWASATASRSSSRPECCPAPYRKSWFDLLSQATTLVVSSTSSVLTRGARVGQELVVPINHFSGSYTCDDETHDELVRNAQIVLRYKENPNGSRDDIAGVTNKAGNVVGLMPHPERAMSMLLGSADGVVLFESFLGLKLEQPALAH